MGIGLELAGKGKQWTSSQFLSLSLSLWSNEVCESYQEGSFLGRFIHFILLTRADGVRTYLVSIYLSRQIYIPPHVRRVVFAYLRTYVPTHPPFPRDRRVPGGKGYARSLARTDPRPRSYKSQSYYDLKARSQLQIAASAERVRFRSYCAALHCSALHTRRVLAVHLRGGTLYRFRTRG